MIERSRIERTDERKKSTLGERALNLLPLFNLKTEGTEHLQEIPEGAHVIYATSHLSNLDMPLAIAALAKEGVRNLRLTESSVHEELFRDPLGYLGRFLAGGPKNSMSISYVGGMGPQSRGTFNPNDYNPMKDTLLQGDGLVVAAYYDPKHQEKEYRLPNKGGYAAAYLANITPNTFIVPVAVDTHSDKPMNTPDVWILERIKKGHLPEVNIRIGKPLLPQKIEGIEDFGEIIKQRKELDPQTDSQKYEGFSRMRRSLKEESDRIMAAIAELLPEEKRPVTKTGEILK